MSEPTSQPESSRSATEAPIDPLAETRMAPAEPLNSPTRPPTNPAKEPTKPDATNADPLVETFAAPSVPDTPQLPPRGRMPAAPPVAFAPDPTAETRIAPSRLNEPADAASAPTRLAPPSVAPAADLSNETIAHTSQAPEAEDPAFKKTRVMESPSAAAPFAKNSGVPVTLAVDGTKQPPVSPGPNDTPFVPTPGYSSIRSTPGIPQHVGDYEILGILGRGGMGVVYKAKQKQLKRIVALKMILGGLHASDEDLRRFRQEAEASARLQHPNIVQIHEIGEVDGKPYFSLEFVDGGSLANKMMNEPQAAFAAAQLIEILARAMHYAHQRGIVHRDLKPANILLGNPPADGSSTAPVTSFGIPKITDFGLAKRMDVDVGQTQSGAILGTPSYMAPEQAGGRIREIGPCTDIYALGAILYDLLTGRPPFKANTLADTLRQVQMVEPVSPGRLQPQVPRDLATICLKCLNKEPKKRYATSLELAEDLGRFLAGEPIRARPTSVIERTWKWSKRRPAIAALIAVSVLSFVALGVGGWLTSLSLNRANTKLQEANDVANFERSRAEENLEQALQGIDSFLTQFSVDLTEVPLMEKPRAKVLQRALALFDHLPGGDQQMPKVRFQNARAKARLGEVQALLDNLKAAETAYGEAETGLSSLVAEVPAERDYRAELARTYHDEGMLFRKKNLQKEAERSFREAMNQRTDLVKSEPENLAYLRDLAQSTYWLGTALARMKGKQQEAEEMYLAAIDEQRKLLAMKTDRPDAADLRRDYERDEARMLNNLGLLLGLTGRKQKAIDTFQQAEKIQKELAAKNRDIPTIRRELGRTLNNLAFQQWQAEGRTTTAETTFGEAIALLEELVRNFPSVPAYQDELAGVYRTQGVFFQATQRLPESEQSTEKALAIHEKLVKEYPSIPEYQSKLSDDYLSLGKFLLGDYSSTKCEKMLDSALNLQLDLVKRHPDSCDFHSNLAFTYKNLGTRIYQRLSKNSPLNGGIFATAVLASASSAAGLLDVLSVLPPSSIAACLGYLVADSAQAAEIARQAMLRAALDPARRSVDELKKALEIEPRRADYVTELHKALIDLAQTEIELLSYQSAAKTVLELARLEPNEVVPRLVAADLMLRAIILLKADRSLEEAKAQDLERKYASVALENLKAAGRIDSAYAAKNIKLSEAWWKSALTRPDFKSVIDEMNRQGKPAID
jgi:serine/threonine protein kinase